MIEYASDILLAIAAVGSSVAMILSAQGKKHAKEASVQSAEANDAVNHRHRHGTPRLYDLALENRDRTKELLAWKQSYDGGQLDNGSKVEQFMKEFDEMKHSMQCKRPDPK